MAEKDNANSPENGTWEVLPPDPTHPKRMRLPLATADDVRKEMARLYRQMKAGQIAPGDGTKFAYVLTQLRQAIETGDLEARLLALEKAAEADKS
ncbi:hypothetical protein D0849_08245 [Bordetella avium]|uniref:hypothetical protein n=1 Tax=Bordetella avium TaxID=521 RepID=UPI000E685D59|nr:hypothetical protein [Bordetella avium]RIQ20023.1 hypothetical protein D0850_02260 [Bordetella avium]RIQ34603.1 hypothetical protein D0849_08245 [Bordetella avium]